MAESSKGDRENKLRSKYALELDLISRERYEMKLKLFDGGFVVPDPYGIKDNEWSLDITKWPPVEYADLFNYFINTPGLYTKESLKAYKSLEGYDYFVSGHVQEVYMCEISPESPVTLLKSRVKPSQRMNDEPHEPWICVDRHAGYIIAAHCTCKAGTCFFQVIFIVLCLLGHAVWVVDMIPILVKHYPDQNHTFWPFVAVFINYYFLHKAWITDPGEITKSNVDKYLTVYKYDELLYNKNVDCSTCKTVKPARSKHCSVCNCCVHRFDHHCIWTNNCVGAYTHRYFILFMMSLIAMFLQGIYVGSWCIMDFANDIRLFKASYIKDDGSIHPITFSVAFQHLFMQLPRLVFLVIGLSVLTVLVFVFLCQHIYFIITNQTTNETYKIKYIDWETLQQDDSKDDGSKGTKKLQIIYQPSYKPYDQGVLQNFIEHLFMQLPRLVFLVIGLSVLTVLVFVFLCQHIYFIITNQTTNETYKIKYIDWETLQQDDSKDDGSKGTKKLQIIYQPSYKPYDQGVLQNFIEVFFPKYFMHQKLKAMNKL